MHSLHLFGGAARTSPPRSPHLSLIELAIVHSYARWFLDALVPFAQQSAERLTAFPLSCLDALTIVSNALGQSYSVLQSFVNHFVDDSIASTLDLVSIGSPVFNC